MKQIIIINKIVFFKYSNIVFFFNLESKSTLSKIDFKPLIFILRELLLSKFKKNRLFFT